MFISSMLIENGSFKIGNFFYRRLYICTCLRVLNSVTHSFGFCIYSHPLALNAISPLISQLNNNQRWWYIRCDGPQWLPNIRCFSGVRKREKKKERKRVKIHQQKETISKQQQKSGQFFCLLRKKDPNVKLNWVPLVYFHPRTHCRSLFVGKWKLLGTQTNQITG